MNANLFQARWPAVPRRTSDTTAKEIQARGSGTRDRVPRNSEVTGALRGTSTHIDLLHDNTLVRMARRFMAAVTARQNGVPSATAVTRIREGDRP